MVFQTTRAETEDFLNGITVSKRTIARLFQLTQLTKNVSFGGFDGLGPRYGTAPWPYHGSDSLVANFLEASSLIASEAAATGTYPALTVRRKYWQTFGFKVIRNIPGVSITNDFVFLTFNQLGDNNFSVRASIPSTRTTGAMSTAKDYLSADATDKTALSNTFIYQQPDTTLANGLDSTTDELNGPSVWNSNEIRLTSMWRIGTANNALGLGVNGERNFARIAFINVTGKQQNIPFIFGLTVASDLPTATNPGQISLGLTGAPNDYFYSDYDLSKAKNVALQTIVRKNSDDVYARYNWRVSSPVNQTREVVQDFQINTSNYDIPQTLSPENKRVDTITAYVGTNIIDPLMTHRSNYKWFGIAANARPLMAIWRDDCQSLSVKANSSSLYPDNKVEWFDASNLSYFTPTLVSSSVSYREEGAPKESVWSSWPNFDYGTGYTGSVILKLGAANSGLLRANTAYEFTYSVYDYTIDYETNVGVPAKIYTDVNDLVNIQIIREQFSGSNGIAANNQTPLSNFLWDSSNNRFLYSKLQNINFLEFRVYYRQIGEFEWLPAGKMSASEFFFFDPSASSDEGRNFVCCQAPIALLPGGQPGGFVDYSPLPTDDYIDVVQFQNRAFWLSRNNLSFSLRNNPFAYPVRNAVPCPRGEFRGIISHVYPGQAEQSSRLVIFGSLETYAGRFVTGAESFQQVRVGPDSAGTFPVDGSNFIVDTWTSITSFSGRSAVLAEGVLYFWGPQGIYEDGGVNIPRKISESLEPWIDSLYDANNTDRIHAVFNAQTDECIWFYQPQEVGGIEQSSSALVWHTKTRTFSHFVFTNLVIDSAEILADAKFSTTNDSLSGNRIVVSVRAPEGDTSRPMFFDEISYACDMQSTSQYMVTDITDLGSGSRRLTFAPGPASRANKTGIAVIHGYQAYTGRSETPDGIYTITGTGANFIEVTRLSVANDFFIGALNGRTYFPCWIASEHAFNVTIDSQYWAPFGLKFFGNWLYSHMTFQVELENDQTTTAYNITAQYSTLQGTGAASSVIRLSDNSRGNFQVLNGFPHTQDNKTGQAMKLNLSNLHLSGRWNLQYLAFDIVPIQDDSLRIWEG